MIAFFLASVAHALTYHASIEQVYDVRDTYVVIYPTRVLTSATAECRVVTQRVADANPSAMIVSGPTVIASDRVAVTIEPGQARRGNVYWCRVRAVDSDGNTPTAELRIAVTEPR